MVAGPSHYSLDEEDGKEEPGQDTEQLPEDGSADSDEEEGDERLDQNPSN
jgi:hypothetical protein